MDKQEFPCLYLCNVGIDGMCLTVPALSESDNQLCPFPAFTKFIQKCKSDDLNFLFHVFFLLFIQNSFYFNSSMNVSFPISQINAYPYFIRPYFYKLFI